MYLDLILGFNTFNYHYTIVNQPSVLHSSAFILTVSIDTYVYPYAGYGGGGYITLTLLNRHRIRIVHVGLTGNDHTVHGRHCNNCILIMVFCEDNYYSSS